MRTNHCSRSRVAQYVLGLALWLPLIAHGIEVTVLIEGIEGDARRNVELLLDIAQRKDRIQNEAELRSTHARAPLQIRRALEPFGYYRARIDSALEQEQAHWTARYRIDPGPPLRLAEVDIRVTGEGENDPAFREAVRNAPLRVGDVAYHARYDQTRRALQGLAAERGYFEAELPRHELRVDLDRYRASAILHLSTGPRYRFGDVRFEQDYFPTEFLNRFTTIAPDVPYSNDDLLALQAALSNTNYFEQVQVRPRLDLEIDRRVPVEIGLTRRPPNRYTFGIGYGTDTGARGTLGWERRPLNPRGHSIATELELSEIRNAATASYIIPVLDPRTDRLSYNTRVARERTLTSLSETSLFGGSLHRMRGAWRETLALSYQREYFETGEDSGRSALLIPAASWMRAVSDSPSRPLRGSRVQFDVRGAHQDMVSDTSFWQMRLSGRLIRPLAQAGRFILRADAGYTDAERFEDLPASLRFYTGGSESVRGYAYQRLGPLDSDGEVVGGRYLTVGSIEYEHFINDKWGAAVFYDMGRAFNERDEPFSKGAGIGARWRLPVGMLRLDAARALNDEDRAWRVHFSVATEP